MLSPKGSDGAGAVNRDAARREGVKRERAGTEPPLDRDGSEPAPAKRERAVTDSPRDRDSSGPATASDTGNGNGGGSSSSSSSSNNNNRRRGSSPSEPSGAGGKQESSADEWTELELSLLHEALLQHGRDWEALQRAVESKTVRQVIKRVALETAQSRIRDGVANSSHGGVGSRARQLGADPRAALYSRQLLEGVGGFSVHAALSSVLSAGRAVPSASTAAAAPAEGARVGVVKKKGKGTGTYSKWTKEEVAALFAACAEYGRDWVAVSNVVGKTTRQCFDKANFEITAGRMPDPGKHPVKR